MSLSVGNSSVENPFTEYGGIRSILHLVIGILALLTNTILLFLVPFSRDSIKLLPILLCFFNIVSSTLNFFLQPRIVWGDKRDMFIYGYCRKFSFDSCYLMFLLWQIATLPGCAMMAFHIYQAKCYVLNKTQRTKGWNFFTRLLIHLHHWILVVISSVAIIILKVYQDSWAKLVVLEFQMFSLDVNIELEDVLHDFNFLIIAVYSSIIPFVGIYTNMTTDRRLKEMTANNANRHLRKTLKATFIQCILYFLCGCPIIVLLTYTIVFDSKIIFPLVFLPLTVNIPAITDPIIMFYSVRAYRVTLHALFGRSRKEEPARTHIKVTQRSRQRPSGATRTCHTFHPLN